jgi:hypothetical protein
MLLGLFWPTSSYKQIDVRTAKFLSTTFFTPGQPYTHTKQQAELLFIFKSLHLDGRQGDKRL